MRSGCVLSDVSEYAVERPGDPGEIEGAHEQARVLALAAGPGSHEPVKLPLGGCAPAAPLPLEDAERPDITLSPDDVLDRGGAEGADRLVPQVGGAHVEAECLHTGAGQARAEARPPESALEGAFLVGVTQAGQPDVDPVRAEQDRTS